MSAIASVSGSYVSQAARINPPVTGPPKVKNQAEEKSESPAQEAAEHESSGGLDVTA